LRLPTPANTRLSFGAYLLLFYKVTSFLSKIAFPPQLLTTDSAGDADVAFDDSQERYSVSSGLIRFDRGHPLLAKALSLFEAEYRLEWEMFAIDPECVSHYHHIDLVSKILSIAWRDTKNQDYEVGEQGGFKEEDGNDEIQIEMRLLPVLEEGAKNKDHIIGWSEVIEFAEADVPEKRWNDIKSGQLLFRLHEKLTANLPILPNSLLSRVLNSFRVNNNNNNNNNPPSPL